MKKAKQPKSPPVAVRWYAPDEKAAARLLALGATERGLYRGWKGQIPGKFKMRPGEFLGVVDGLRAFGTGKRVINQMVEAIHSDGATVLDLETGKDSRTHGTAMFSEATGPLRMSAEFKRKMADEKAEARRIKAGGMAKREAQIEWKKAGIMSADERAELIGIPRSTLYALFGPSGATAGRRPKHLLET